jgi:hypothetical protein
MAKFFIFETSLINFFMRGFLLWILLLDTLFIGDKPEFKFLRVRISVFPHVLSKSSGNLNFLV